MIIASAPLRVSFFGGGSDYPDYYRKTPGQVLSSAINKRVFVCLQKTNKLSRARYIVSYSKIEAVDTIGEINHPAVRKILESLDLDFGLEISITSELPAKSGLGSSSTFVVAFLAGLYRLLGIEKTDLQIALDAIHYEQNVIGDAVGSQDQVAAAMGSLNRITFKPDDEITVERIACAETTVARLFNNLFLCFTNQLRFANSISVDQIDKLKKGAANEATGRLLELVEIAEQHLVHGRVDEFAELMNSAWSIKRRISSKISNNEIDDIYTKALANGAIGGKLLGAGGGGFFLFYVPEDHQQKFLNAFKDNVILTINSEASGVRVNEI